MFPTVTNDLVSPVQVTNTLESQHVDSFNNKVEASGLTIKLYHLHHLQVTLVFDKG